MYYNIIKFPFSSVNDNGYTLAVCLNSEDDNFDEVNKILAADTELFRRKPTQLIGGETVYNWEGTLTGSVKATDDEREDMWTPLVCSKLSFNMACQDFPVWLMDFCNNNRARVIVYKNVAARNIEQWRGYLIAQTLNMTVVRNLLSCPLVAVDEVAMAKYMNFKATTEYATNDHWCTLFGLMEHYHDLHHSRGLSAVATGFEKLYTILNLSHTDRMLWHRDMAVMDGNGNSVNDLPSTLVVNLDRWLQDKEATWEDCLSEICEYLGVTFAVGSYGLMVVNDAYLLTCPTDSPTVQQFVYTFGSQTVVSHSTNQYLTLANPTKIGGNLQITAEPDRYKEVLLTSKPERWKGHEYLTEEEYKPVDDTKFVRMEWGEGDSVPPASLQEYNWHKLKYLKPSANESDYLTIPPCANGEGYVMARSGILPYENIDSCNGIDTPEPSIANSLDFITFKEGCCVIALGQGEIGGVDEDRMLKRYFLILNHMWSNMLGLPSHTMQTEHLADTNWIAFKPFGTMAGVHPGNKHYLSIKMAVKFIRENFPSSPSGGHDTSLFLKGPSGGNAIAVNWTTPAMIMPAESSLYDFSASGPFNASLLLWSTLYFEAYIRIGNFYYNGTNWVLVGNNETPPKCQVTMWSESNEIDHVTPDGNYVITTANYYYNISSPYRMSNTVDRYTNSTSLLANAGGVSIHNQPLHGQLEMQILGQIRFQKSQFENVSNSVPFLLINDVEFGYTDDAEFIGMDETMTQKVVMDADSHTKDTLKRDIKMASPTVDGFFDNVLVFDNGKAWQNLTQVKVQGELPLMFPPEWALARRLGNQYGSGQLYVELETPIHYDDNVHNVCFRVQGLTETAGTFLPVKRTFDYTLERLRVKLMRINAAPVV
jgi:hypothetical protein